MAIDERIEQVFAVSGAPQLSISNVRGSIRVTGDDQDSIRVTAVKRLNGCQDPERTVVEVFQEGDRVVARTRCRDVDRWSIRSRDKKMCDVDYEVFVPSSCDVDVHQVNGTIYLSAVNGRININAVKGGVELHKVVGRTNVRAVSASVEGDGWSGRADVNTVSGPVQIAGAQLSRLKAHTVSAGLSVETTVDEGGHYDFHSVSGDVTLYLPLERGVVSRGTTISGQLVCDLPHEFSHRGHGGWQATINGGGPPVRFHSVSGDLEVLAARLMEA
jgi:hypothetical protein